MLTDRQQQILQSAVTEYINVAQPISSQLLEERYEFGVSSATIRNEMLALSDKGYLVQPYTSAGRIPTDKGYRFLVNQFLSSEIEDILPRRDQGVVRSSLESQDPMILLQELARELSFASSLFAAASWRNHFFKEGWESLFLQPEFENKQTLLGFTKFVEDFERNLPELSLENRPHVSIGKENRFSKVKDFSIMVSVCEFGDQEPVTLALLGPRRMAYDKNLRLLDFFIHSFHG